MGIQQQPTPNKAAILKAAVEEQRHFYHCISNTFDQLRIKALTLIAGEVAIITFLFVGGEEGSKISLTRIDVIILFAVAVGCLLVAFGLLLWTISTVIWKQAHGYMSSEEILKKYKSEQDFLHYLNNDYANINMHNANVIAPKLKRFNWIVYLLSAGAVLILLIKYGGVQI